MLDFLRIIILLILVKYRHQQRHHQDHGYGNKHNYTGGRHFDIGAFQEMAARV